MFAVGLVVRELSVLNQTYCCCSLVFQYSSSAYSLVTTMEPIKEFSRTVLSLDNCIIPTERLLETPSIKDGMNHDLETDLRIVGCEYIQSAGLLLKLPQVGHPSLSHCCFFFFFFHCRSPSSPRRSLWRLHKFFSKGTTTQSLS